MKATHSFKRVLQRLSIVALLVLAMVGISSQERTVTAAHAGMPPTGLVCTTNPTDTFTLTAKDGQISMPDGNVVYMWGYSEGGQPFQHPSPVLCVDEGDTVTVVLNNTLDADVSIVFPGQEDVLANGAPSQPVFDGNGELVSLAPMAAANGGSVTYEFVASRAGTYIYESGTEPAVQINMGLFGALVVRPGATVYDLDGNIVEAYAYNHPDTQYRPEREYLLLISEIDPMLHVAVQQGYEYDMNNYTPRYWNYNGRSFPDTVADNGADWLPTQPYGALIYTTPFDGQAQIMDAGGNPVPNPNYNPHPALNRIINVGTMDYSHHPHGNHGRLIAWDGHLLKGSGGEDMSSEEFTVTIGPGQTLDTLFEWVDVEQWHPVDNPIPVVIPQLQDLTVGQFYSGSPYLGALEDLPVGTQGLNQCGEYYHIAHNHALHQITAWGVVLSGHITFARIDPPLPNNCAP
jgi:FtsP/CotA-like multicopper oxidase with cupredoxin domain